ncbi:hypothetical protein PGB90_001809 [Kerria lacca]
MCGGKETNQDSLSSGERSGKSPAPNPAERFLRSARGKCGVWEGSLSRQTVRRSKSPLNGATTHRGCQARSDRGRLTGEPLLRVGLLESAALSGW